MIKMNDTHRPALVLSLIFIVGILLGKWLMLPIWSWLVVVLGVLLMYCWKRTLIVIYALVLVFGATWATHRNLLPCDSLAWMSYRDVMQCDMIEGIVTSSEEGIIDVGHIAVHRQWYKKSGAIKLRVWGKQDFGLEYGLHVRIKGKMFAIHDLRQGSFSYRQYLQERGIFWMFAPQRDGVEIIAVNKGNMFISGAASIRRGIKDILNRYLEPREAAFVGALLIGDRRDMPKDLKEIFVKTGTAHILAISGMNMAVIVSVLFFVCQRTWLRRRWKFIMTAVFLFVYAYISGWSPSVVRATIMSAVLLSTFAFEYEGDALNSLGVAALILLWLDTNNLFNVGFQLSFAAVAGILLLTKPIEGCLYFLPKILAIPIAVSVAAFFATAGIIAYHFHMITPISILANIPIVPLADLVMVLGLGLVCVSFYPMLAVAYAAMLKAVLSLMILCAGWFSQVPWGCLNF